MAAQGHEPSVIPRNVKSPVCTGRTIPQLENIVSKTGIHFGHDYVPDKKYIVESMGGGVILLDYDRDGWPDIYFTNNPSVSDQLRHKIASGALYRNNHNGTFSDVTASSGMGEACYGMGGAVGDYDN